MKIISGTPGSGKTTQLIERSATTGDKIVCASGERINSVMSLATHLGYQIPIPISYSDFLNKRYAMGGNLGFLIDDLEDFFGVISPNPISAVTVTTFENQPSFLSKESIENQFNLISLSNEMFKGAEPLGGDERDLLDKALWASSSKTPQVKGMK